MKDVLEATRVVVMTGSVPVVFDTCKYVLIPEAERAPHAVTEESTINNTR